MRPQDPEWIGMSARQEHVKFVDGHAGYFKRAHARITNLKRLAQMSCADFSVFCSRFAMRSVMCRVAHSHASHSEAATEERLPVNPEQTLQRQIADPQAQTTFRFPWAVSGRIVWPDGFADK
jgi:hypothetical protein